MTPADTRGAYRDALGWAAVAAAVRIAWLARVPAVAAWDGLIYARTAARIARGMGFVDTWNNLPPYRPTAFYPVGYPALLGAAYLIAGTAPWVAGALNVLAATATTGLLALLARRAWNRPGAWLAAGLYALSPGAVMYASTLMTETVSGALLVVTVWAASRHRDHGAARARWGAPLAAGVLLGVGALVRPQALLLAPVVACLTPGAPSWRARARVLAVTGLACAAVVLPWTVRNCIQLDGCALVSVNGGSNLWIGTDPDAAGNYRTLRLGEGCDRVRGEVAKDRCYGRLAARRIAADPRAWIALAPAKVTALLDYEAAPAAYLSEAPGHPLTADCAARATRVLTAWHRAVLALALLAALPLAGRPRWSPEALLAAGAVVASVAVHAVFFGGDRYHFVFAPLLALLAGGVLRRGRARPA